MKEFFGIGGYQRTPEGAYSWQHLLFVFSLMALMVGLAVFLGLRNRNRSEKTKNCVLIVAAILIDCLEIFKITVFCIRGGNPWGTILQNLPLFMCSIQLITLPLAAFAKGRLKTAAIDFLFIFGILGAVFGTIGAAQNYGCYPVLSMDNVFPALPTAFRALPRSTLPFPECSKWKSGIFPLPSALSPASLLPR